MFNNLLNKLPKLNKANKTPNTAPTSTPTKNSADSSRPLIELKDIYKIYHMGDSEVHALDGISLTINKGEFVAIVGQSGSGKSTCMNIIGCLDVPTSGTYMLGGIDVSAMNDDEQADIRNKMLGFIFQQYNLIPKLTVLENVELSLLYAGIPPAEREQRALNSLAKVGLSEKSGNLPSQLSGGQQQRVSIARALAGDPSLILADEPTGALDSRTSREVLRFLQELHREGNTIVLITHDNSIAVQAKRIVRLTDGRIVYDGPADDPAAVVQPDLPPLDDDKEIDEKINKEFSEFNELNNTNNDSNASDVRHSAGDSNTADLHNDQIIKKSVNKAKHTKITESGVNH